VTEAEASAGWNTDGDLNSGAGPVPGDHDRQVLILGIGNILWADEGFGVRALETLAASWHFGPNVQLLDGGTQGIYLVDQVRSADVLVVFDAVDYGLPPGTLKRVEGAEVPRFLGAKKMSLHQTGFQEVLALAALLGDYPEHLLLIGAQPVELDDFGGSLRPEVKACIAPAITMALDYLAGLGITAEPRRGTGTDGDTRFGDLPDPALGIDRYESGRPSAEAACRVGDPRVLAAQGAA
jgi:hydrogenase maturation protease